MAVTKRDAGRCHGPWSACGRQRPTLAPLCCQWLGERAEVRSGLGSGVAVASMLAGSESDLSEAPVLGFEPAALDFVVAPGCPSGPVLRVLVSCSPSVACCGFWSLTSCR